MHIISIFIILNVDMTNMSDLSYVTQARYYAAR